MTIDPAIGAKSTASAPDLHDGVPVMTATQTTKAERIARLNDLLRTSGIGGRIMMTAGVAALDPLTRLELLGAVRSYDRFTADDDPYGEHDFGSVDIGEQRFFWKIESYDLSLTRGSPDPTDNKVTARVLTIMVADEY